MYRRVIITIVFKCCLTEVTLGQVISRQVISSLGSNAYQNDLTIKATAGQPFGTAGLYKDKEQYRPGFQQPSFKVAILKSLIETNVYPNPATRAFHIVASEQLLNGVIKITDISGRELYFKAFETFKETEVSCADWPSGNYFTSITVDQT
jgi:hypothetical protein